ncbi:MAG: ABC transporter permease [Lachnospiraceae bacterium]|nr:ABC transporter permease [Lachnospiraceae bacterium]
MEYVKSAYASIRENKGRSFLTMLGIIIGISSVITILAIGNGLKTTVGGQLGDIQSGGITISIDAKKTNKYLTGAEVRMIGEEIPEAYGASPKLSAIGEIQGERSKLNASFTGGNEIIVHGQRAAVVEGRFFNESEAESGGTVAVLTQAGAVSIFGMSGDVVGKTFEASIGGKTRELTVVGLLKSSDSEIRQAYRNVHGLEAMFSYIAVHVPYTLLTQGYAQDGERIISYQIFPYPNEQDPASLRAKRLTESVLGLRGENAVSIQSFASFLDTFNRILDVVTLVVAFIAAISLIVGGIGVMNIMTVSVTERTREIGIRKALGARTSSILVQFLAESAMITVIGGIIGMLAGYGLTFIVSNFMSFPPQVRIRDVVIVVSISASIGLFFGIYPAFRAAKMNPIEALRYE